MKKLIGLLAVGMLLATITAPSVAAAPVFSYTEDDQGQDDEPGQKDLTAQSSDDDAGIFYTSWKWDDTAWNGNNSGDGCSLFDTDAVGNDLVDFAACGIVKGKNPVGLVAVALYSCNDTRADRCSGATLLFASSSAANAATFCTVTDKGPGEFPVSAPNTDTIIVCNITALGLAANPDVTSIGSGSLLNTCSYPSQQPNSDPSDCVLTVAPADPTDTNTTPSGTPGAFSVTLNDSASVTPAAAGTVTFKLFLIDSDALTPDCNAAEQVFTSGALALVAGSANTTTNVSLAGTYEWTADFVPTDPTAFIASSSTCGEETVVVTAPTVTVAP